MNYLISGANGFVGRELIKQLRGNKITAIIRLSHYQEFFIDFPEVDVLFVEHFHFKSDFEFAFKGQDVFFHLAGKKGIKYNNTFVEESIESNIFLTQNLLEASVDSSLKKFIFLSSEKAFKRTGVYGAGKYICEKLIEQYSNLNPKIEYKIVRCGNIAYSNNSLMTIWRDCLKNNEEILISDPKSTKFLCSVQDCVKYLLQNKKSELYYIPEMKSVSLAELFEAMREQFNQNYKLEKLVGMFEGEEMSEFLSENYNSDEAERLTKEELKEIII